VAGEVNTFGWTVREALRLLYEDTRCHVIDCGMPSFAAFAADDRDYMVTCQRHMDRGLLALLGHGHGAILVVTMEDQVRYDDGKTPEEVLVFDDPLPQAAT